MQTVRQIVAATSVGLRSIPQRLGTSLVVVVGVATVVAVFVVVLSIAAGFVKLAANTGHADRAIVLSGGAANETASALSRDDLLTVSNAPGIASADGGPVLSAEALAFVSLVDPRSGLDTFVTVRGVGPQGTRLRPEIALVAGRVFEPGKHEMIVGRGAQIRLSTLTLGSTLSLPQGEWRIVGAFASGNDSHESELLTDSETLMSAYNRKEFSSILVRLTDPARFAAFRDALQSNPNLSVSVQREDAYYWQSSRTVANLLWTVAFGIGGIMAIGAAFGSLNTMYTSVSARAAEIGTLRAIGFGGAEVAAAILLETLLLALCGAAIGSLAAWVFFHGSTVSALTGDTPSQLTFALTVTPQLALAGVIGACLIGLVGGLFPAIRAGRSAVVDVMRAQ